MPGYDDEGPSLNQTTGGDLNGIVTREELVTALERRDAAFQLALQEIRAGMTGMAAVVNKNANMFNEAIDMIGPNQTQMATVVARMHQQIGDILALLEHIEVARK